MKHLASFLALAACLLLFNGCASVDENSASAPVSATSHESESSFRATSRADRDVPGIVPYPFRTCAVQIHKPFKNGKPKHRRVYQGHEVLFCCDPCVMAFDMNPDPYMPRIKEAAATKRR